MSDKYELMIFKGSGDIDRLNDNVDVEVCLAGGRRYSATFFTLHNLSSLMERYAVTGECKNGLYIWASHMIVVNEIDDNIIKEAVDDLLRTGEFFAAFSELED